MSMAQEILVVLEKESNTIKIIAERLREPMKVTVVTSKEITERDIIEGSQLELVLAPPPKKFKGKK